MYSPTTRLLTVLELLQSNARMTGPELAARLEVPVRSVRRYVTMLRDIGIPVDSDPGRYGAYYLRRGFRLPPLMFNNPEIVAIILGLMAVRRLGLTGTPGVESAVAKIERVLPDELRSHTRAIQGVLTLDIPAYQSSSGELMAQFSLAAHQNLQLWIQYRAGRSDLTERTIDVYGLVYHAGFWYAAAHCHLRKDLRTFRLDRVEAVRVLESTFKPPKNFDALDYLMNAIASTPGTWHVEVLLKLPLAEARERVPGDVAFLDEVPEGVMLTAYSNNLDWFAHFLVSLRCTMEIINPPAMREELRKLAQSILVAAAEPASQPVEGVPT
jgi:predicted DNA-binding transcriptional regulator YafY